MEHVRELGHFSVCISHVDTFLELCMKRRSAHKDAIVWFTFKQVFGRMSQDHEIRDTDGRVTRCQRAVGH